MSQVIGYDGTLTVFRKNPIAVDVNIFELEKISEDKVIKSINMDPISMNIICKQNSINFFYKYFEKNKIPLFFHIEFK